MNELRGHAANERQMQAKVAKCNQNEIEIAGARTPDGGAEEPRRSGSQSDLERMRLGVEAAAFSMLTKLTQPGKPTKSDRCARRTDH